MVQSSSNPQNNNYTMDHLVMTALLYELNNTIPFDKRLEELGDKGTIECYFKDRINEIKERWE